VSKQKWAQEHYAEQTMRKFGVQWTVEEVDFGDVDWKESATNQARIGPSLNADHVGRILIGLQNGDSFPMPVVRRKKGDVKKFTVEGGHHCVEASKQHGLKSCMAYVFESNDDDIIRNLPRALNPPTLVTPKEHSLIFARDAVERDGWTITRAAATYNLSEDSLRKHMAAERTRKDLVSMGIDGAMKLPTLTLGVLSRLKNANVQKRAAKLVCDLRLKGEDTARIAREVNKQRTEASQIVALEGEEKAYGYGVNGAGSQDAKKQKRSPAVIVRYAVSVLEKYLAMRTFGHWGITDRGERVQMAERLRKIAKGINSICKNSG
jgi:hypothetical protein